LLNRYRVVKLYRGFESLRLRQHLVSQRAPSSPNHQKAPLRQALLAFSTVAFVRRHALKIRAWGCVKGTVKFASRHLSHLPSKVGQR
jgi:hypothetical protein